MHLLTNYLLILQPIKFIKKHLLTLVAITGVALTAQAQKYGPNLTATSICVDFSTSTKYTDDQQTGRGVYWWSDLKL